MPIHVVQQGECMSSLAARYGFAGWADLYNHPDNAALKKKRPNPNVLAPGDEVVVPEKGKTKSVSVPVEFLHKFKVKLPKVKLRMILLDSKGEPYEGKKFKITVGARETEETTAAGGLIEVEVPASAKSAQLQVWFDPDDPEPDIDRELEIGHLDPLDQITGVQGRLANLGYPCGVTGELDPSTLYALRLFRTRSGLPAVEDPLHTEEPARRESGDDERDPPNDDDGGGENDSATHEDDHADDEARFDDYVARLMDDALRGKLQELYEGR